MEEVILITIFSGKWLPEQSLIKLPLSSEIHNELKCTQLTLQDRNGLLKNNSTCTWVCTETHIHCSFREYHFSLQVYFLQRGPLFFAYEMLRFHAVKCTAEPYLGCHHAASGKTYSYGQKKATSCTCIIKDLNVFPISV